MATVKDTIAAQIADLRTQANALEAKATQLEANLTAIPVEFHEVEQDLWDKIVAYVKAKFGVA